MVFEDNFVQPVSGWLIDPVLKVRMTANAPRESYDFDEAVVVIWYDPEIKPGRLTQPPSPQSRARRLAIPSLAHLADEPQIFESDKSVPVKRVDLQWSEPTDSLRLKVPYDCDGMALRASAFELEGVPQVIDNPEIFMLHAIKSAVKLDELRGVTLAERYPQLKRIEVLIQSDVARDVFRISSFELSEAELGWVVVASREVGSCNARKVA